MTRLAESTTIMTQQVLRICTRIQLLHCTFLPNEQLRPFWEKSSFIGLKKLEMFG